MRAADSTLTRVIAPSSAGAARLVMRTIPRRTLSRSVASSSRYSLGSVNRTGIVPFLLAGAWCSRGGRAAGTALAAAQLGACLAAEPPEQQARRRAEPQLGERARDGPAKRDQLGVGHVGELAGGRHRRLVGDPNRSARSDRDRGECLCHLALQSQ